MILFGDQKKTLHHKEKESSNGHQDNARARLHSTADLDNALITAIATATSATTTTITTAVDDRPCRRALRR